MKSQLTPFENYVTSLVELGVFPTFERIYNGWNCALRNSANIQIMPTDEAQCWAETMIDALTLAVEGLNNRFKDPADLQKFINTGVYQNIESLLDSIESLHRIKTAEKEDSDNSDDKQIAPNFLH